jgi:hypothetical protein
VQMRKKVRGLREIERAVLAERAAQATPADAAAIERAAQATPADAAAVERASSAAAAAVTAEEVVLDYCAAVRGILNDNHGGPQHPPGERMAEALADVRQSLQRNLEAKKGGPGRTA